MRIVENKNKNTIQSNLFEYFKDGEEFTIEQANECILNYYNQDVKKPSIRARIYEGIDKGMFKRVAKGVYIATERKHHCLLVQGDGRDLSFIEDNSIDAIITDHPYDIKKSHKGGNRQLVNYDAFQYTVDDFREKYRVLKPGGFMVEMLPERNADNIEYINRVLDLAQTCNNVIVPEKVNGNMDSAVLEVTQYYKYDRVDKSKTKLDIPPEIKQVMTVKKQPSFEFYAVVPWEKGDFVINQGRKSKNTEDIYFFTKGKARNLKLDNKKNLALAKKNNIELKKTNSKYVEKVLKENGIEPQYMSGTAEMLPISFNHQPPSKKDKIHKAEKPISLFEDIIKYVTFEDETILDQFGGSGNSGKAALNTGRNSIVIEQDDMIYEKMVSSYEEFSDKVIVTADINEVEMFEKEGFEKDELDMEF